MIKTKAELVDILKYEEDRYFPEGHRKKEFMFLGEQMYKCWRYSRLLRLVEYHHNNKGLIHKLLYMYWRFRKNSLGIKLGIEMWDNTFEKGLLIFHAGNIVVNGTSKIGKNCKLHGSNCIGNNGIDGRSPIIGNNVDIGVGAKIIGGITIADNVKIGAGAVVIHSCNESGVTLAGIPARVVRRSENTHKGE